MNYLQSMMALLPPALKGRVAQRLARTLGSFPSGAEVITTNLAVNSRIRFQVPATNATYAFGRPAEDPTERGALQIATQLSSTADAFLDVGANRGLFSCYVRTSGTRIPIVAIEADPGLADDLSRNVQRNDLNIEVVHAAASDLQGQVRFYKNLDDELSGSITQHFSQKHRLQEVVVPAIPLASILQQRNFHQTVVKVDVEGAGLTVWQGLKASRDRISALIMEVIGPEAQAKLPEIICRDTGWYSYYICDLDVISTSFSEYTYVHPYWNWLFTPLEPKALQARLHKPLRVILR